MQDKKEKEVNRGGKGIDGCWILVLLLGFNRLVYRKTYVRKEWATLTNLKGS